MDQHVGVDGKGCSDLPQGLSSVPAGVDGSGPLPS
jgi:hypothetical protein